MIIIAFVQPLKLRWNWVVLNYELRIWWLRHSKPRFEFEANGNLILAEFDPDGIQCNINVFQRSGLWSFVYLNSSPEVQVQSC